MISRKAELIIHPVRLRILRLLSDRQMTVEEIHQQLGDVPIATLYRHVNTLTDNAMLHVVETRRARGAKEHRYTLAPGGAQLDAADISTFTRDDHRQYFTGFAVHLLNDFNRYITDCDLAKLSDDLGYQQHSQFLNPREQQSLEEELKALMERYSNLPPGNGRRQMILSTVIMPGEPSHDPDTETD